MAPSLAPSPPATTPRPDPDPAATATVRAMLVKSAAGALTPADFAYLRQTIFPRLRAALEAQLRGKGPPTRLEFLARRDVGDDRELEYFAWYGPARFRVAASWAPSGGLTGLRVTPEPAP